MLGVALGATTIVSGWTGFDWVAGPAAIGAIGAVLLAFASSANLPTATDNGAIQDQARGIVSGNIDPD